MVSDPAGASRAERWSAGHGGAQVSKYCSVKVPELLQADPALQNGDHGAALSSAFQQVDQLLETAQVQDQCGIITIHRVRLSCANSVAQDSKSPSLRPPRMGHPQNEAPLRCKS